MGPVMRHKLLTLDAFLCLCCFSAVQLGHSLESENLQRRDAAGSGVDSLRNVSSGVVVVPNAVVGQSCASGFTRLNLICVRRLNTNTTPASAPTLDRAFLDSIGVGNAGPFGSQQTTSPTADSAMSDDDFLDSIGLDLGDPAVFDDVSSSPAGPTAGASVPPTETYPAPAAWAALSDEERGFLRRLDPAGLALPVLTSPTVVTLPGDDTPGSGAGPDRLVLGLSVAAGLAVLLAIILGACLWRRRRTERANVFV